MLFTNEFLEMLDQDAPNYGEIRSRIIRAYNEATGETIDELIASDEALIEIARWLNRLLMSGDPKAHFFRMKKVLLPVFSSDLSSKISALAQFNCAFCHGSGPSITIPIRIKPITYQASSSRTKRAFKKAIDHRLRNVHSFENSHLCVHITFVIGRKGIKRDADNMAKLLLDAMQGSIFVNDNQVDHLSLLKLRWQGDEEWVVLHVADTEINQHDDVLYQNMNHSWAGASELLLEQFMDP